MVISEDIRITVILSDNTEIELNSSDISGNVSISSQAVSGNGFELGAVCSSQFSGTFRIPGMNRYKMFAAVLHVQIFKNNQWINAGVFNVTSSSRYRDMITVSASDNLIWLDKEAIDVDALTKINLIADYISSRKSIYQLLKYVVEDIGGLELAQSQSEIEAMPNGDIQTISFQEISADVPRDWLSWIAQTLGGFAYADENGKIAIGHFGILPEITITDDMIQADSCDIADFEILLAGVRMSEVWDGSMGAVWNTGKDGKPNSIYVEVSDNWVIQGKHYIYLNAMDILENLYGVINTLHYRPFNAVVHTDTMLHIGQCIDFEDDEGNLYTSVITHHSWTLNGGQKIECAGSDTRLLADTKKRTALKRESEKLSSKIENAKGIPVADEETLRQIKADGHLIEGMVYYVADEHEYNA